MLPIALLLACYLASLGLTEGVRRLLLRYAIMDIPNARSSHTQPTPRGGGWAIIGLFIPILVLLSWYHDAWRETTPLLLSLVLLVGISWADDRRDIRASFRLSLHLLCAGLGTMALPADSMILDGILPFWLDRGLIIVGWAWFMNLYNFMDGIDGITGTQSIALACGLCLLFTFTDLDVPWLHDIMPIITGIMFGFLAHNWHKARIFMGDIGSIPLGYVLGFGLITLALHGYWIPAFILPLYYLADSGITLIKRALRGEKIWKAHREHFYQKAALSLGRHDTVVTRIALANLFLIIAASLSLLFPWLGLIIGTATVAILLFWMQKRAGS